MGQALYRKYRSRALSEIVGQSHITAMLTSSIKSGHTAHAYLLTGPRGVGKTSIARILAHEINGLPYSDESTHLDIIEIDAASNNSVEDIRELRNKVSVAPTSALKKIYIIDEVHMLSKSAFNALLKTLEEPPEHVVFILATTDAEKLPATIISRVQRFNFRMITPAEAIPHLRMISDAEGIDISDEALALVAHHGQGSMRDSVSLLDQLRNINESTITPELIERVVGLASTDVIAELIHSYESRDIARTSELLNEVESRGIAAAALTNQLVQAVRVDIADHPERLVLLDKLIDTSKSAWPHVKLLTALTSNIAVTSTVSTNPQPAPVVVAVTRATASASKPAEKKMVAASEKSVAKAPIVKQANVSTLAKPSGPPKNIVPSGPEQPFPWADFREAIKVNASGAYSLLGMCGYSYVDNELTIFAGKVFTKKQIDRAMPHLSVALEAIGITDGNITVVASIKPPKDSAVAAALDIMGGGEEVSI